MNFQERCAMAAQCLPVAPYRTQLETLHFEMLEKLDCMRDALSIAGTMDKIKDDGGLSALVMQCAFAVLAGHPTVTISVTGKRPEGWPRGELLSVGTDGTRNYAVHPLKILAWLHGRAIAGAGYAPNG